MLEKRFAEGLQLLTEKVLRLVMSNIDKQPRHENNQKHENQNGKKNRLRIQGLQQRTTSIAISILVTIVVGVLGIEVLSAKQNEAYKIAIDNNDSKSLKIIALEKKKNQPGITSSLPPSWTSDQHSPKTSRELRRLQAKKIKELKRQLNEADQKLHEIKANLFTKGDPADRLKLADICQRLAENEKQSSEFQHKIKELEAEKKLRNQKIVRMEQTIDALAAMTDSLRESKENIIFNFQNQVERLENDAERERKELKKIQASLEQSNLDLQDALAAKTAAIKTLENEISRQYHVLKEKSKEIDSQSRLFTFSENHLQNEKKNLLDALELAMLKNKIHLKNLEKTLALGKAREQHSKSIKNQFSKERNAYQKQIDQLHSDLVKIAKNCIELQGITNIYAHSQERHATNQNRLKALIRKERSHAKVLQNNLEDALSAADTEQQRGLCIEEELHASAQKIHNMEEELLAKQSIIEAKEHELEMLNYSTASLRDQLNTRIKQLTASLKEAQNKELEKEEDQRKIAINLEIEKAKYQELYNKFQDASTANNDLAIQLYEMQQQVYKDSEHIIAMEGSAKDQENEIEQLRNHSATLTRLLNQEKQRSNELHTALSRSLRDNESLINTNSILQENLEKNTDILAFLQDRIESKKRLINDMQERLGYASSKLAYEQNRNREIEIALEDSKNKIKEEKYRALSLMSYPGESQETLDKLKQQISSKDDQIKLLKQELKNQTAYNNRFTNSIKKTSTSKERNFSIRLHKVKNGENLRVISAYYYGTPNHWIDIYNANREKIPDKNRLEVGVELVVPE